MKYNKSKGMICSILLLVNVAVLFGCAEKEEIYLNQECTETESETLDATEIYKQTETVIGTENRDKNAICYVYVCGAVRIPGVYQLPCESRIYEAIQMAGGMTEEASDDINQAEMVTDGMMVRVLTVEEALTEQADGTSDVPDTGDDSGLININTAEASVLMTLPGIGQSKADSIISYREKNGGFSSVEDIKKIEGIKEGVYSKIKDSITVN